MLKCVKKMGYAILMKTICSGFMMHTEEKTTILGVGFMNSAKTYQRKK